jgi:hypothetical protein
MPVCSGRALCCALLTLFVTRPAAAEDRVALQLRYEAPASCPTAEMFFTQVEPRTPLARAASPGEPATALVIVIKSVPGGSTATLELRAPDGATSTREVSAAQCEQVVTALALMTALAVDPNASVAAVAEHAQPAAPAKAAVPPPSPRPPATAPASRARLRWEVGAAVEVLGGVATDPVLLVRPFVELGQDAPWGYALRVSAARAQGLAQTNAGAAQLTLWAGRLEACPLRFEPSAAVRISPCLAVDAGQLQALGKGVSPAKQVDRPWLASGGIGRLEFGFLGVLAIELSGELFLPIVRDRFFVGADTTVHRAPAVAGGAALGLGVRFP